MTSEDRVRTVREAYQATIAANQQGGPWNNPWAAIVAALDTHDEPHTKALAETATTLGFELGKAEGRKQAAAEFATLAATLHKFAANDRTRMRATTDLGTRAVYKNRADGYGDAAEGIERVCRDVTSQPQEGAPEPLTAPGGYTDLPEAPEAGRPR